MKNETDKLSCAVVRDLLPLYHDGVVSDETKADVEAHIADCTDCTAEYEKLDRELPADESAPDTRKLFSTFAKKRKKKNRLVNVLCFLIGAVVVLAWAVHFMRTKQIVPYSPEAFTNDELRVYHYKYENCPYKGSDHIDPDHGLFIYLEEPAGMFDSDIVVSGGDVNIEFKHPIWNPDTYGMGTNYRIWIIPVDDSCRTLSINGRKICGIGEPNVDVPPYVEAYHRFESLRSGMWEEGYIDENAGRDAPCDYFVYYPNGDKNGGYIKWDLDGNEIENTLG